MHHQIRILLWLFLFLGLTPSCIPDPPVQEINGGLRIDVNVKGAIDPQQRLYVWATLGGVQVPVNGDLCPSLIQPPRSDFSVNIVGGEGDLNVFIDGVSSNDRLLLAQGRQATPVKIKPKQISVSVTVDQWENKNEPWRPTCANGVIPDMASPTDGPDEGGMPPDDGPAPPPDLRSDLRDPPPDLRSDLRDPPPDMTEVGYDQTTETFAAGVSPNRRQHTYLLLVPRPKPVTPLPLVIALPKDGSSALELQSQFRVEDAIHYRAIVLYLNAADNNQFHHNDLKERGIEADYIKALINSLVNRNLVDRSRVLLTGFGGGGAMASAVGCVLGKSVLKGAASMSGPLYTINDPQGVASFATLTNGTQLRSCSGEPPFLLFWGEADRDKDTVWGIDGLGTLNRHRTQQASCPANPTNAAPSPCKDYVGCRPGLRWCSIPNLAHAIWTNAASATWQWFSAL